MRSTFVQELINEAQHNRNLILLTGDLGSNCLEPFADKFPDRFFNCGIAEQNMLAMAAGLAMEGKKVFVYSIGNFDTLRTLEQVRNDICYMNLDVNIIAVGAGFEYGQLGFSHHTTEDIACMRCLPNMTVFSPATVREMHGVMRNMFDSSSPCYVRLNKKGVGDFGSMSAKACQIIKGQRVAVLATGTIIEEALEAAKLLREKGINISVYSFPTIKPKAEKGLKEILKDNEYVFTLEEHSIIGGFGSSVAELLAESGIAVKFKMFGIEDRYLDVVGDRVFLRQMYKIDAKSLVKTILKAL